MDLKNGYKVIYDVAKDGKRNFYASKTGVFADAEPIFENVEIGDYKLIYEKDGMFYGSTTGVPAESDRCFTEFNKVFIEGYVADEATAAIDDEDDDNDAGDDEAADAGEDDTEADPDDAPEGIPEEE